MRNALLLLLPLLAALALAFVAMDASAETPEAQLTAMHQTEILTTNQADDHTAQEVGAIPQALGAWSGAPAPHANCACCVCMRLKTPDTAFDGRWTAGDDPLLIRQPRRD